jgi:hypothetical protein
VVSTDIIIEWGESDTNRKIQYLVYFVSKVQSDSKTRYFHTMKLTYALLITSCKLSHYFQAHLIEVHTSLTLGEINEDMPSIHSSSNETPLDIAGPITRSRAKQLQKEIHSRVNANLMFNNQSMLNEPMLLSSCFNVLRNYGVYEPA